MAETNATETTTTEFTAKQAIGIAFAAMKEFYPNQELIELALEEIDKTSDGKDWLITLSFGVPLLPTLEKDPTGLTAIFNPRPLKLERKFKVFRVDVKTGQVRSMKIRTL